MTEVEKPGEAVTHAPAEPLADQVNPLSQPAGTKPVERGGPPGPEPTRYGDWEKNGRCIDF